MSELKARGRNQDRSDLLRVYVHAYPVTWIHKEKAGHRSHERVKGSFPEQGVTPPWGKRWINCPLLFPFREDPWRI